MPNEELNVTTLEDVVASIQGTSNPKSGFILQEPIKIDKAVAFEGVSYDMPKSAVYDRLSDGSYIPKFENYIGATGNEERLAKNQGGFEQAVRGLTKFSAKVGLYASNAIIGTAVGIYEGISTGSLDAVWNNSFSNKIDDINKRLDNNLANYYTEEEKSLGLLAAIPGFGGATNFWFNDVAGGLAFVAGAMLPEAIIGVLSGGTTLGISAAKIAAKTGGKALGKSIAKEAAETGFKKVLRKIPLYKQYEKGNEVMRSLHRGIMGGNVGEGVGTALFLARTSNFEAGMEARHNFHSSIEAFHSDFVSMNDREPTYEETTDFMRDAKSAANGVYGANLAILTVSNAVMFSSKFKSGRDATKSLSNRFNRHFGLGVKHTEGAASKMIKSTKGQRILGNTYLRLGKPAVEGLYEEGFQGVAGTTMQNYLEAKYNPKTETVYDFWAAMTDGFANQYGTADGWKEMGIGMIIGSMGGTMQKGQPNFAGFGKGSRKNRQEEIEKQVENTNTGQENLIKNVNTATALSNFSNVAKSGGNSGSISAVEETVTNAEYIKSQEALKTEKEIIADYDAVVDNTELSEEQLSEFDLLGEDGGSVNTEEGYKSNLKESFRKDYANYKFARRAVVALGLDDKDRGDFKDTKGNTWEIQDHLIRNIMIGKTGLENAKTIASQIDAVIGSNGIFSSLEHYGGLNLEKRKAVIRVKIKQDRLEKLKEKSKNFANKIAGLPSKGAGNYAESTKQRVYQETSDKAFAVQKEIYELEKEILELGEALDADLRAENFNIDKLTTVDGSNEGMLDAITEIDKLDKFILSLEKAGRITEAEELEAMVEEYKMNSDAHREMNNTHRRMMSTNFFKSGEGKGLRKAIIGSKYTMSEEFKKELEENDEAIDKSLRLVGYRGKSEIERLIKVRLEENEELSEREKFRLESILRLQLGYGAVEKEVIEANKEASQEVIESGRVRGKGKLQGDTVQLKRRLEAEGKDLGNVSVLGNLISKITTALDIFKLGKVDNARIGELQSRLEDLTKKINKIDKESIQAQIKGFEEDLAAVKRISTPEMSKEEEIKGLEKQIAEKKSELSEDLDVQVEAIKAEIKEVKTQKVFKIMKSPEYKRLYELNTKKANGEITLEEVQELEILEEDIDQWMMISGIQVEGIRLSDLIQQKSVLDSTTIEPIKKVVTPSTEQIIDSGEIPDNNGSANYSFAQSYDGVTLVKNKKGLIEVSGMNWETFANAVGIPIKEFKAKGKRGKRKMPTELFEVNERGNILMTNDVVEMINSIGRVTIGVTSEGLTTNYSMVLNTKESEDGGEETTVLKSDFQSSFEKIMDITALYDIKPGEEVVLEIDPKDKYNKELIEEYNNATTDKGREKVRDKMRKGLVIRVLRKSKKGEFVAVLKSKRDGGMRNKAISDKFEALRDQIVNNEKIFQPLIDKNGFTRKLKFEGIKVKTVYIGHPNFNYSKNEEGKAVIETIGLTENDIKNIDDVGYVDENGNTKTMSGKDGVKLTFIAEAVRTAPAGAKIPFVVISKGNQRIAIPVVVDPNEKEDLTDFEDIYNSSRSDADKAAELNIFMAKRGVDIKLEGNSFIAVGVTNLTDSKFFTDKLAQLQDINYFRDLETWSDSGNSKEQVLAQGVSTSVNIIDPVHSPKLMLDYTGLDIEISEKSVPNAKKVNEKTSKEATKNLDATLKNINERDC
jgi:hypothetical protein